RGGAGEVVDLVDLDIERKAHIVPERLEMRVRHQVRDIVLAPGEVIIDAHDVVALGDEPLAQMRAQKPGAAGDENPLSCRTHRPDLTLSPDAAPGAAARPDRGRC